MTAVISEFSTTILNPFDLQQLLHRLTGHAAELTGSQGAGIMLAGRSEGKLGFAAASSQRMVEMELVQDRVEAGACYQAFLDDQLIVVEDLEGSGRWPAYERRAAQLGVRSVLAVPMHAWGEKIGVLNIYREEPGEWSSEDVEAAQIITSMGSGYVLHANQIRAQHELTDQLQEALKGRDLIGQAKGILMSRHGVDADTAFDQLRTISQTRNVKLREVASRVVEAGAATDHPTVTNGSAPAATTPSAVAAPRTVDLLGTGADDKARDAGSNRPADKARARGSETTQNRAEAAKLRDEAAAARDEVAQRRDEDADRRDAEADHREQTAEPSDGPDPGSGKSCAQAHGDRGNTVKDRCDDGRERVADRLDTNADDRDEAAELRVQATQTMDRSQDVVTVIDARCLTNGVSAHNPAASAQQTAAQDRLRTAGVRTAAGVDRDASAADRMAAADDRRKAAQDRDVSAADRAETTKELNAASLDALTGTYARGPGIAELERDRSRADRIGEPLTLAFVDVDDLTGTNLRGGHPAGDRLLRQVAEVLTEHTRSHDVIVRYGGDEFICALVGLTRDETAERMAEVSVALGEAPERGSITVGLAELEPAESLSSLIRRADADLYHQRRRRSVSP